MYGGIFDDTIKNKDPDLMNNILKHIKPHVAA